MDDRIPDHVDAFLSERGVGPDGLDEARRSLIKWFRDYENPDQPLYLVPQERREFTASDLVAELEAGSEIAQSFVEMFVAGALMGGIDWPGVPIPSRSL